MLDGPEYYNWVLFYPERVAVHGIAKMIFIFNVHLYHFY